jgi:integrase
MSNRPRHTGSLCKRRRLWYARVHHGRRVVEVSAHTTDLAQARKVLRALLRTVDTPAYVPPSTAKVTFETLCTLLRRDYRKKNNRSRIEYKITHLAETFAGWPALDISTRAVDDYVDQRTAAGAARATVNRELAALRRMFRLALADGLLPSMPKITTPAEDNTREGFLDPPDALAFLATLRAEDADVADATEFAYRTALRRGNVPGAVWPWFALTVKGGHVVGGGLRVPGTATKNKSPLTLPLTGALLALVDRRWQCRVPTCPYVSSARACSSPALTSCGARPRRRSAGRASCSMIFAGRPPARCAGLVSPRKRSCASAAGRRGVCSPGTRSSTNATSPRRKRPSMPCSRRLPRRRSSPCIARGGVIADPRSVLVFYACPRTSPRTCSTQAASSRLTREPDVGISRP